MFEDDQDTLAAEYVLGTLSAQERDQAEALLSFDPQFEAAVRQWERRLGELNVMVEAVESPPRVWEKIKIEIGPVATPSGIDLPQAAAPEQEVPPAAATLAADLLPPETEPAKAIQDQAPTGPAAAPSSPGPAPKKVERSADVVSLESKVKRWRDMTLGIGALAALLAIYIAVGQFKPDLIPAQMRPAGPGLVARTQEPARSAQDRLVAVLQQQPTAPAFLLTLDTQKRTLIVRRVSATPEAGRSYELWLISKQFPSPRSLGIVGNEEFTQRALPANTNVDTLRGATYAVSLEPAGGSPSGVPTGPVLFTGKAVESLPATPSPANATPKT